MIKPSAKAREIAAAFIRDNEIMADSETEKMRAELAALIDEHLREVREALEAFSGMARFFPLEGGLPGRPTSGPIWIMSDRDGECIITVEHLHAAVAALAKTKAKQ